MRGIYLLIACLGLTASADVEKDLQSLKEIKAMLAQMKARSAELEKMSRGLKELKQVEIRPPSPSLGVSPEVLHGGQASVETCGLSTNLLQVQQCVLQSVNDLRKLSDELE